MIVNLQDVDLGSWLGSGPLTGEMHHCVASTTQRRDFSIRITGIGSGGAFVATNGTDSVPFSVEYNDRRGSGWVTIQANRLTSGFRGQTVDQCNRGNNRQRLRVTIAESALGGVTSGSYSGALTLLIVPQ